ncbi:MAG: hypothetical protein II642_02430, partial [Firmicutes bacterium]|nr:hypothetical protein [Bacillota bacterium]
FLLSLILVFLVLQKRNQEGQTASQDSSALEASGENSSSSSLTAETSAETSGSSEGSSEGSGAAESSNSSESASESSSETSSEASSESSSETSDASGEGQSSEGEGGSEASSESSITDEDLPDDPDLQFETSDSYYDDINVKVLTAVLSQDFETLSEYVGDAGLRLSPMGEASENDVILSASEVSSFFSRSSEMYGIYLGSGGAIRMMPDEYYRTFINPDAFDFALASALYDDAEDLAAAAAYGSDLHTVGYHYVPNVMEWQNVIFVYQRSGERDWLVGIIYQDLTTG